MVPDVVAVYVRSTPVTLRSRAGLFVRQLNLALKFLLELAALAAFALWGASIADGAAAVACAVGLPLGVAMLWGLLAAPKARRRLSTRLRIPFELGVFALATLALLGAEAAIAAAGFAAIVAVNALFLTAFDQWDA